MICLDRTADYCRESHAKSEKQADLGANIELHSVNDWDWNQSQESICKHPENCRMLACVVQIRALIHTTICHG